jgi:fucose 4-O-acetylase-like acetyltransferase
MTVLMTSPPVTSARPKPRVAFWDNARWVAVTLVIMGHAILKLIANSDPSYGAYLFIYLFQVPVLVMVSGYFAKAAPPGLRQLRGLITDIIAPYIVFEAIWSVVHWMIGGKFSLDFATASWTLWFLVALAAWRVILPYLAVLRYPLTISIIISVGAGYFSQVDDTFALARIAGLLPFFVFGWKLRDMKITERWLALRSAVVWRWRAVAIALFLAAALVLASNMPFWRASLIRRFLLFDETYASFGYDQWWAGGIRLAVIAVALLLSLSLLVLIPRRRTFFTVWGTATMYIYLLHTFFLYPIRQSGVLDSLSSTWWLVAMLAFSVAISMFLSQPFIRKLFHPIIEPKLDWLLRERPPSAPPTGQLPASAPAEQPAVPAGQQTSTASR